MVTTASPSPGMIFPISIDDQYSTFDAGNITIHPTMSFHDFLSVIARKLSREILLLRVGSVTSIEVVEHGTSSALLSSSLTVTRIDQEFDLSSLVDKQNRCTFLVNVKVDLGWDMERGDPVVVFEAWPNWREDHCAGIECGLNVLPAATVSNPAVENLRGLDKR